MTADLTDGATATHTPQLMAGTQRLLSRGIAYAQSQDFDPAIACFTRSIHLITTALDTTALTQPSQSQISLTAIDHISTELNLVQSYYHRGCARCRIEHYSDAIADFTYLLQPAVAANAWVQTKHAEIYIHRGNAHRLLGNYLQSLNDLNQGIEKSAGSAQGYSCRGLLQLDRGEFERAIADFDQALSLHPTFSQGYLWRGFASLRCGQPDHALSYLTRAIEAIPNCAEAYNHRGVAHFQLHDLASAQADFEQAIRLKPGFAEAYSNRGNLRQHLGDMGGAIADYNRAIALDSTLAELYFNRATTAQLHDLANLKNVNTDYDQTAGLPINSAAFYRHRAQARAQQGKWKAAISDYSTAIAIIPTAYAHYHRGLAYLKTGNSDQALIDLDCALALSPDYGTVYCDRTQLRFRQQNIEGALEDAVQAISLSAEQSTVQSTEQTTAQKVNPLKQAYAIACLANFCLGNPTAALKNFQQLITHIQSRHQSVHSSSSHTSNEATSMGSLSSAD